MRPMMQPSGSRENFCQFRQISDKHSKMIKSGKELKEKRERLETLAKLKHLVPQVGSNQEVSKLELLQYVIDYISDLQHQLDSDDSPPPTSPADLDCSHQAEMTTELAAPSPADDSRSNFEQITDLMHRMSSTSSEARQQSDQPSTV